MSRKLLYFIIILILLLLIIDVAFLVRTCGEIECRIKENKKCKN